MSERQKGPEREPKQVVGEQCLPAGTSGNAFSPSFREGIPGQGRPGSPCSVPPARPTAPLAALRASAPTPAGANRGSCSHESHRVLRPDPGGGAVRGRTHPGPHAHPAGCHALQEGHRQGRNPPPPRRFPGAAFVPGQLNMALSWERTRSGVWRGSGSPRLWGVGVGGLAAAGFRTRGLRSAAAAVAGLFALFAAFAENVKKKKSAAPLLALELGGKAPRTSALWIPGKSPVSPAPPHTLPVGVGWWWGGLPGALAPTRVQEFGAELRGRAAQS